MNWRALLVGVLLALPIAFQTQVADAAALAPRSIVVVPTPSGNLDLRHLDGDDGTAEIPLVWAALVDRTNEIEGTAASYPLCANLTQPGSPNATVTLSASVSGWSIADPTDDDCTLAYSGTGTSAPTSVYAIATRGADVSNSLPFLLGAIEPDTDTCISGFTCAAFSGASCDFTASDSNTQIIEHTGPGACATYKTFSGEPNRNFAIDIKSGATFNDANFSGGGVFLMGGADWATSYVSQVYWPKIGRIRFRSNHNGSALDQNCAASTSLSQGARILYDAELDEQSGWESEDNSTYTQCGNSVNDGPITSGFYGFYVQGSTDATNPTTMTFDVVTDSTTLPGDVIDPPDPPLGFIVSKYPGGPPWASGVGQIATPTGQKMAQYASWLNWQAPDMYVAWASQSGPDAVNWASWSNTLTTPQVINALADLPATTTLVIAYPLLPLDADPVAAGSQNTKHCANLTLWDNAAAGDFDQYVTALALALRNQYRAARPSDPTGKFLALRWGWELTGDWYAWSICNKPAQFKAYWERSVPIFRAQLPDMLFDVSPARTKPRCLGGSNCSPQIELATWMPDPAYWDILTRSLHNDDSGTVTSAADFVTKHVNSSTANIGLKEVCDYAVARGKKCGSSEWGTGVQGGNCPANVVINSIASQTGFLQGAYNFFLSRCPNANSCDIGWEATLSDSCQGLYNKQSTDAAILFKSLWGD